MKGDLHLLTARDAVEAIVGGSLSSEALVEACLSRIAETDATLRAWAHLDAKAALEQAREMDRVRKSGRATGKLHGVPIGLKDIIDTTGVPCERGSALYEGRVPVRNATIADRLIEAGAVVMGKTKTTELAFVHPTDTTNPHDPARSPGGSSSGSAAAVAAHQVPLAIGSQTGGSVIRPASFCGIYGLKPTRGMISRQGVLQTSTTLDHLGTFGRTLEDAALLADVISGYDPADDASLPRPRPDFLAGVLAEAPVEPTVAWLDFPFHDLMDDDAREGMEAVLEALGTRVERLPVADTLAGLAEVHITIHEYEFCHHLAEPLAANWDKLSATLQPVVERGRAISDGQYQDALEVRQSAMVFFAQLYNDFDAIIEPAATGEAPLISSGETGDPIFCRLASFAGLPSLTLPILVGENGMPIGVQLIGGREEDARLLRTASWVQNVLKNAE
ncbi:MAG: amidase [Paracoccaceae bacterium]|nr:amidase [Paracoccaceae bacterium]